MYYRPVFWKSRERTDLSFLEAVKRITKMSFSTASEANTWLLNNGYWTNYLTIDTHVPWWETTTTTTTTIL